MNRFNFEKNLDHQSHAVDSTIAVFDSILLVQPNQTHKNYVNPTFDFNGDNTYQENIRSVQEKNEVTNGIKHNSNILDIMMETGTGKTYTYTKTIFELNKSYGIFKFIVVVPTLSIKAGTINFLKSDSPRDHFKEQYNKTLHLHIVESKKNTKNQKSSIPPAVASFVSAGNFEQNSIQVMIINSGMINSETMQKSFDRGLFDKYTVPFDAIGATSPFVIIDEPHKFGQSSKTWDNLQKLKPQFILRYGATFQGYENLIYTLTAVDSFNRNLVKGIIGHITEFNAGQNAIVKFIWSDGQEARFELFENNQTRTVSVSKKESLQRVHREMTDLVIDNLNRSTVVLSNGLEMKTGDKINPYSYAKTLQETMIQKAIKHHFEIEKQLLTRDVKIKPLTLFFIDNIDEYRNEDGYIRKIVEQYIKVEIEDILNTEKNSFYRDYLEKTLTDLSATHAGYFSKDNNEKDEAIEKELNEILHDKQAMLDLKNPRRFIFSKWTLREGWDNPNVFQICKLRSSGSEISKLQEVGRGLRLPVNEFGNRVKDEPFYLHYFVDFTENDFVDKLVNEINQKSGAISIEQVPNELTDQMIKKICELYNITKMNLLIELISKQVITENFSFETGGFDFIKKHYPLIFEGVNSDKIRKSTDTKKKISVSKDKYPELKDLWEKLNEKVIIEYKFNTEETFKNLVTEFLKDQDQKGLLTSDSINEILSKVEIIDNRATSSKHESIFNHKTSTISVLKYSDFLKDLSKLLNINMITLHGAIIDAGIDINKYLSQTTLRILKQKFDFFLMTKAFSKFSIEYKKVSNAIHPTKLTDVDGNVLDEIPASDVGLFYSGDKVAEEYFFKELYFDSDLEKQNIITNLEKIIVFTKIPKNSIKIPIAGGKSYSPDFAYVIKSKNGEQKLNLVVETKGVNGTDELRKEEEYKIKHAKQFFQGKVKFKVQFSNDKITSFIRDALQVTIPSQESNDIEE